MTTDISNKLPDAPGCWAWRVTKNSDVRLLKVVEDGGKLVVKIDLFSGLQFSVEELGGIWLGPVPEYGMSWTIPQILKWWKSVEGCDLASIINNPQDGIKAFTERDVK